MFLELAFVPNFLPPKYIFYFSDSDVISISLPQFFDLFWLIELEFFKSVIVKLAESDLESITEKSHLLSLLPVYIVENIKQWNLLPISGMLFFSRLLFHIQVHMFFSQNNFQGLEVFMPKSQWLISLSSREWLEEGPKYFTFYLCV